MVEGIDCKLYCIDMYAEYLAYTQLCKYWEKAKYRQDPQSTATQPVERDKLFHREKTTENPNVPTPSNLKNIDTP